MSRSKIISGTYETRMDVRTMATLCKFYIDNHEPPVSLADLQRKALEDYVTILENNERVERVEGTLEAKKLLEATVGRATCGRGDRALIRQIQVETGEVARAEIQPAVDIEDIKFGERPTPDREEKQ